MLENRGALQYPTRSGCCEKFIRLTEIVLDAKTTNTLMHGRRPHVKTLTVWWRTWNFINNSSLRHHMGIRSLAWTVYYEAWTGPWSVHWLHYINFIDYLWRRMSFHHLVWNSTNFEPIFWFYCSLVLKKTAVALDRTANKVAWGEKIHFKFKKGQKSGGSGRNRLHLFEIHQQTLNRHFINTRTRSGGSSRLMTAGKYRAAWNWILELGKCRVWPSTECWWTQTRRNCN